MPSPSPRPRPEYTLKYTLHLTSPKNPPPPSSPPLLISALSFSPSSTQLAVATNHGSIYLWTRDTTKNTFTLEDTLLGHLAGINDLTWSPTGSFLLSASDDKTIRIWSLGLPVSTGFTQPLPPDLLSRESTPQALDPTDALTTLKHPNTHPTYPTLPKPVRTLTGHAAAVYSLSLSPRSTLLASGSYDESIRIWDFRTGRLLRQLPAHSDPVSAVQFNPDGTMLVSASHDGLVRLWDSNTGQCLRTLRIEEENPPVGSVCFSANGEFVLASTLDSCLRLWDFKRGKVVKTFMGHVNRKYASRACVVPRRGWVVAGSERGEEEEGGDVYIWDEKTKEVVQLLIGHEDAVLGVGASADGAVLATGGLDGGVKIWVDEGWMKVVGGEVD